MRHRELFAHKPMDDLNMTPLLDLAWTLLVVFVIAVTASVQGIKVDLPGASTAVSLMKPKTKAISITRDGQIYLDAYPVTLQQLEDYLRKYKAGDPNLPVVVSGDKEVVYNRIMEVLDLLSQLDITQVGLVTKPLVK